jgi:hypothetical protein
VCEVKDYIQVTRDRIQQCFFVNMLGSGNYLTDFQGGPCITELCIRCHGINCYGSRVGINGDSK